MKNMFEKFKDFCNYFKDFDKTAEINRDITMKGETMKYSLFSETNYDQNLIIYRVYINDKESKEKVKNRAEKIEEFYTETLTETNKYYQDGNSLLSYSELISNKSQYENFYKIARVRKLDDKNTLEKIISFNTDKDRFFAELKYYGKSVDFVLKESFNYQVYKFDKELLRFFTQKADERELIGIDIVINDINYYDEVAKNIAINKMIDKINYYTGLDLKIENFGVNYFTRL